MKMLPLPQIQLQIKGRNVALSLCGQGWTVCLRPSGQSGLGQPKAQDGATGEQREAWQCPGSRKQPVLHSEYPVHGTVGTPEAVGVWSLLGKAHSILRWVIISTVKMPQNISQLRKKGQDSA